MAEQLRISIPRKPLSDDTFQGFVRELNARLDRLSALHAKQDATTKDQASALSDVQDALDALQTQVNAINPGSDTTSEADTTTGGSSTDDTSQNRDDGADTAQALIDAAQPSNPPPNIARTSSIGTTTNPTQFALADHTHGDRLADSLLFSPKAQATSKRAVAGTYGDATHYPVVTVDNTGRVIALSVIAASGGTDPGFRRSLLLMGG